MVGTDSPNRCGTKGGKTIAKWIRDGLGISREEVTQPMHWFRHYVRSALLAKKVDRKIRNMITATLGTAATSQSATSTPTSRRWSRRSTYCPTRSQRWRRRQSNEGGYIRVSLHTMEETPGARAIAAQPELHHRFGHR